MKRFTRDYRLPIALTILLFSALLGSVGRKALAQTLVQQSATALNACSAANATAAVNNQVTLTLTPPSGQFVYLCGLDFAASQNATSTANTNSVVTSTNLGGWAYKYSLAAVANTSLTQSFYFTNPVKAAASGTAVTIVSPAALAQCAFSINAYYYFSQ